jgi:hypothetical protein
MRSTKIILFTGLLFLSFPAGLYCQEQTDKKAAELKRLETNLNNARAKVTMYERKITVADSIIDAGNRMIAGAEYEKDSLDGEYTRLEKEFAVNEKKLLKQSSSKDKDEATKAQADLKALDLKYKADTKALENKAKNADKKEINGNATVTKGKNARKTAEDALEVAQANLEVATARYDAAANPDEEKSSGKKKK